MLNYYDEIKNSILEALKEKEYKEIINQAENKDDVYYELYDRFFVDDAITGNASGSYYFNSYECGSYYFNSYESRKHCYEFFRDVFEALESYGYDEELQKFKIFVALMEDGYLNIEKMTPNYDALNEDDNLLDRINDFDEIEDLDFEKLDVITRCYMLSSVLSDVLDNYLD